MLITWTLFLEIFFYGSRHRNTRRSCSFPKLKRNHLPAGQPGLLTTPQGKGAWREKTHLIPSSPFPYKLSRKNSVHLGSGSQRCTGGSLQAPRLEKHAQSHLYWATNSPFSMQCPKRHSIPGLWPDFSFHPFTPYWEVKVSSKPY